LDTDMAAVLPGEGCRAAVSVPGDAEKLVACGRTMVFTMVRSEKENRS
jgi:hypothetical protein